MKPSSTFLSLVVCALLTPLVLLGQIIKVSAPFEYNLDEKYHLIGASKKVTYNYGKQAEGDYIYSYDDNHSKQKEVKLTFEKKDHRVLKSLIFDNQLYVFYAFNKNGASFLRFKLLDLNANELQDREIGNFSNGYTLKENQLVLSKNRQKILVYAPLENNQLEILTFDLIEKHLLRQQELNLDKFNYYRNFEKILINNHGEVFLLSNFLNNKKKRSEHHFLVYQITDSTSTQKIPFPNFVSFDFDLKYDEENQRLVGVGLYGEDLFHAQGVFYFNSSNNRIISNPFQPDFIRSLTGEKKKNIQGINHLYIHKTILRQDGGILLLAEQQFTYQSASIFEKEFENSTEADFLHENILAVSMHPNGQIFWKKVLLKSQSSSNDDAQFSSFFTFQTKHKLRLIYNNKIDWDTTIFEYVVDKYGTITRRVVTHQSRKSGLLPQFIQSMQITSNELVALSYRDKDTRLVKIIY